MILIIGGAGYIGSHVNKELNKQGYETVVLDNLVQGHREMVKWGKFENGDYGDAVFLDSVFKKYPIEAVMHFGAFASVPDSMTNPQKYYENNIGNGLTLLKVMLANGVKKMIFSSSAATFGEPQYVPMDEKHPQNPINPYGETKLIFEKILRDYDEAYGLKYAAFRYFNASGDDVDGEIGEWHEPEGHLIPLVLDAALGKREDIKIFGTDYKTKDGTCVRDYIHVMDLANVHILALDYLNKNNNSQCFNLGNGNGFTVKEVVETCKKITGLNFKVVESDRRVGDPAVLVASSEKARSLLNWSPKYSDLETIVKTAWLWHQKLYKDYKKI